MISAKIIADSVSEQGKRITTFELEYPRFIHSELLTHRKFSRNAMSSRAIPIEKMIEQVRTNPAMPIHWGKNQAGMQASKECNNLVDGRSKEWHWKNAALVASNYAEELKEAGYHKQVVNRLLEPFQWMKTVVTSTEFDNFFWLRCHKDAQPEIKALADLMYEEYTNSTPQLLKVGDYHLPYVDLSLEYNQASLDKLSSAYVNQMYEPDYKENGQLQMKPVTAQTLLLEAKGLTLEQALKISSSCCAQVSFRSLDDNLEKAERVYRRLMESKPCHASPFEHQATPMLYPKHERFPEMAMEYSSLEKGVTHCDIKGNAWSGNFMGWIQHRQLIDNNTCWDYNPDTN